MRASAAEGKILTVFSPKGGVGKTMLAACAWRPRSPAARAAACCSSTSICSSATAAIMMGVEPEKTIYDLVMTTGDLDPEKLAGYVIVAPLGRRTSCPRRCAPRTPSWSPRTASAHLLEVAKEAYDVIVVDTPTHFHATTLATLDRTDRLLLVASLDIPSVKNVKLTLQTLEPPALPRGAHQPRASTAPHAKAELKRPEVERRST